jgi:hypothetical protein
MMKFFKITFIFLVLPLFAVCQSFEGMITYEMEAHNPMPDQMTDEEFNAEMGGNLKHVMSYYYKEDKYKSVLEETQATVLYEPTEMKIYSYTVGQLEGGWFDAKKGVEIQEIIKLEEIDTILGIPCQAIQVKSELMTVTYYYSAKYRVEYEKFKGHKYGFWEAYLKETCGLPLKSVSKMPFFHISLTATDIQEMELDDAIFELPKDIKMQEMETSF